MGAHAGRATLSRFGLKMLAVFAVCAVLPVVGFAGFAYLRTVEQLEADAADSLRREAKARLSAFKVPTRWAIIRSTDVPMTVTGKVDQPALRTLLTKMRT